MSVALPKTFPRLYTNVLEAISELKENSGSHIRTIINHVQSAFNVLPGKPKLRNVALQVRRAIQHGIATGVLRQKGYRVRLSVVNKDNNGVRTCCGFLCGKKKKKKGGKGGSAATASRRRGHGIPKGGGGHKKSKKRRSRSNSHGSSHGSSRSSSRSSGRDPCAPKKKSKRSGGRRKKRGRGGKKHKRKHSSGGGGKKRKRRHSSGGASKYGAPKRKKKVHHVKKKKKPECSVQQYSDEHNEEKDENLCTCEQNEDDQKNSHVSFADEDEICGEKQQCVDQCPEPTEKRKRSNRPPRRTSRQIRQGTPMNLDRCNPEFIPQQTNDIIRSSDHVPRSCNRTKEDYGISKNENTDYINKNFDNNDIHGTSQECDNPDCLCNIKQEPLDTNEDRSKMIRDHCPERFSERKRNDRDRLRDSDKNRYHRDPDRGPDRPRVRDRDHDKDRDRDGRENYFTN